MKCIALSFLFLFALFASAVRAQAPASASQSELSPTSAAAAAEVPRLIKFSGTLLDDQSRPLAGPVGVTFALYAQQSGGAALWMETQNAKPDENGNYTVLLGANSTEGVPAELFVSGEARWLGIQVGQQPEHERTLLVSVPYALKAGDAETLGGKPLSSFVLNEAQAASSSNTTPTTLTAASTTAPPKTASSPTPLATTGTANYVAKFTSSTDLGNSRIFDNGTNVGIGTTIPGVAVDVVGNNAGLRLSGTGTHQVTVTGATSGRLGQDSNGFFFASDTNGKSVRFLTNNGTLNEWMRITSAGNVGISTQTPVAKLDVVANSTSTDTEAVRGQVVALNSGSFNTVGLHGITNSGGGRGVVGEATSSTSLTMGVQGLNSSDAGIGVSGIASGGGSVVGVQGEATAGPVSGGTIGVRGTSASNFGTGVQGEATSSSGFGVGVHGLLFGTTGSAGLFSAGPGATLILGQSSGLNMFSVSSNGDVGLAGNLSLPYTTNMPTGVIMVGNQSFAHSFGSFNTFIGLSAGNFTMTGSYDTAMGVQALFSNTTGLGNTASGASALQLNKTGNYNTASGMNALYNTTGNGNTASGMNALYSNTTGTGNTASGMEALYNTTASNDTASGFQALYSNTTGTQNVADGYQALYNNTGSNNIAFGYAAGTNATTGNNNIYIGNVGVAAEGNTIRIGTLGTQTSTFIAGISGATSASGVAVYANASGQLGTATSSRRFKNDIADMGAESDLLMKLRPVAFYYKPELDETQTRQYGLVAEEVAQAAPQLVVFDKDGLPQTVRYHFVNAMLLNEVQKQHGQIEALKQENTELRQQLQAVLLQVKQIRDLVEAASAKPGNTIETSPAQAGAFATAGGQQTSSTN